MANRSDGSTTNGPSTAAAAAAASSQELIQHYLQQCLEYHDEQDRHGEETEEWNQTKDDLSIEFVSGVERLEGGGLIVTKDLEWNNAPRALSSSSMEAQAAKRIDDARSKMQAILQRFQQEHQQNQQQDPTIYRLLRQQALQHESQRKQLALTKNLAYIERRQEQCLQELEAKLQAVHAKEAQAQVTYQTLLQERLDQRKKRYLSNSQAAIGTVQRRKVEDRNERLLLSQSKQQSSDESVAIYVSGIPLDGSMDEGRIFELFASYGSIRKIHLYRTKETAKLKGDGLVIYRIQDKSLAHDLLETVCSQMNGAELPNGSILSVEPASSNPKSTITNSAHQVSTTPKSGQQEESKTTSKAMQDDDLDDFFSSL